MKKDWIRREVNLGEGSLRLYQAALYLFETHGYRNTFSATEAQRPIRRYNMGKPLEKRWPNGRLCQRLHGYGILDHNPEERVYRFNPAGVNAARDLIERSQGS